jgi:hypothetical protein
MRQCLQEKVAARALKTDREFEDMTGPRLKQWAKDLPVIAVGTGLGYAGGRALGDVLGPKILKGSPRSRRMIQSSLPLAAAITSSVGSYALGRQSALQQQRREEADALTRTNGSVKQAASFAGVGGAPMLAGPTRRNHPVFVRTATRRPVPDREKVWTDDMEDVALPAGDDE